MENNSKWKETLNECRKNKSFMIGLIILVSIILVAIFAEVIAPYEFDQQNVGPRYTAPCAEYLFGTDQLGRDMLSRVIYGSRPALWVAFLGGTL